MTKVKPQVEKLKHPNSRKTQALAKQINKLKTREKLKKSGNIKQNLLGEKIMWFRDNLEPNLSTYTAVQTLEIIQKYLDRFNEELQQIKIKHSIGNRKNRQHASREDVINMSIKTENEEFNTCGLEVPDLLNSEQFNLLKNWNGELRFLPKFKVKRYSKSYLNKLIDKMQKETKVENYEMETS